MVQLCSHICRRRVYVNNLSYKTTWQMLKDHFKQIGNVVHAQILQVRVSAAKWPCSRFHSRKSAHTALDLSMH